MTYNMAERTVKIFEALKSLGMQLVSPPVSVYEEAKAVLAKKKTALKAE